MLVVSGILLNTLTTVVRTDQPLAFLISEGVTTAVTVPTNMELFVTKQRAGLSDASYDTLALSAKQCTGVSSRAKHPSGTKQSSRTKLSSGTRLSSCAKQSSGGKLSSGIKLSSGVKQSSGGKLSSGTKLSSSTKQVLNTLAQDCPVPSNVPDPPALVWPSQEGRRQTLPWTWHFSSGS